MKLVHPDTGHVVHVSQTGGETWRARGYTDPSAPQDAKGDSEQPAKSATRAEWDDYARSVGVNPDDYSSKDDLIEALG